MKRKTIRNYSADSRIKFENKSFRFWPNLEEFWAFRGHLTYEYTYCARMQHIRIHLKKYVLCMDLLRIISPTRKNNKIR